MSTVEDVSSVDPSERRASRKAVAHPNIGCFGVVQAAALVIPYTAELSAGGVVIVTSALR